MPEYFDETTEALLASEWHGQDATKEAVHGLPRMMDNFDASIARMKDARKTLQDADASLVDQETFKKLGAGLLEVIDNIIAYVDSKRPHDGIKGVIPSETVGPRMRTGG